MRYLALAALLALAACSREPRVLPSAALPTLDGKSLSLAACPTSKCLTIEVSPSCPYCRAEAGTMQQLRRLLSARGVATRFVMVLDRPARLREFASVFGADTALDQQNLTRVRGVPRMVVSDKTGVVLRDVPGIQKASPEQLAAWLGL